MNVIKKRAGGSLLGLAFGAGRLEIVVARRTNGSVDIRKSLTASLSLDPLTNAPELVGREIRKHLDEAGIKEKHCAVCVPLGWVMTLQEQLPDLSDEDIDSFLQIEAERKFPYSIDSLMVARSDFRTKDGTRYATLMAVSREHVSRLDNVLRAAQLRPVTFSLGISSLPGATDESENVLALMPGESSIALQVSCGAGVAMLRTIDGAFEQVGRERELQMDQVVREIRITLGQLPAGIQDSLRTVRVFGGNQTATDVADALQDRLEPLGLKVARVGQHETGEFGVRLPAGTAISPALSVAVRRLTGRETGFEFLPPKISAWQQLNARYSSRKLVLAGSTAGAIAAVVLLVFLVQQFQLWRWESRWTEIEPQVAAVDEIQEKIKTYRPWYDESARSLSVLRRLTEAFPEDGTVSAKMVEFRQPAKVTCSGTARDNEAFLKMRDRLSAAPEITSVHGETRGASPVEFTLSFNWSNQGAQ
jgi:Tfp pilus assembly PilM family ATPase